MEEDSFSIVNFNFWELKTYLKILKAKIRHIEYQFDKPDLLIRQLFVPPYRDVSFTFEKMVEAKKFTNCY